MVLSARGNVPGNVVVMRLPTSQIEDKSWNTDRGQILEQPQILKFLIMRNAIPQGMLKEGPQDSCKNNFLTNLKKNPQYPQVSIN